MVKTSILVEVDQRTNDLVVVPHKRAKTFSKLMASLLQGYVEDEYIRAYADGTLDDMRKASVDVLDDALNSMTESLSNMGLYNEALSQTNDRGKKYFEDYSEKKEQEIINNEEVSELKSAVSDLQEQNSTILQLLKQLTTQGISAPEIKRVPEDTVEEFVRERQQAVPEPVVTQEFKSADDTKEKETIREIVREPEEVPEVAVSEELVSEDEDEEDAANLLSSLMSGNQYSF